MSNALRTDLTGKTVRVATKYLNCMALIRGKDAKPDNRFVCESGFGCSPITNGRTIYGYWLFDNERDCIRGDWVESIEN
jgi:hypothetical protein